MAENKLIWPARLHHFALKTEDPEVLADWYVRAMGYEKKTYGSGWILSGAERNIIILTGKKSEVAFSSYAVEDDSHLSNISEQFSAAECKIEKFSTPLFCDNAISITDHDGNVFVFGVPLEGRAGCDQLPGRLQHIVFATTQLADQVSFFTNTLGFRKSDTVFDSDKDPTACFMRSDPEHHSLGLFRAPEARLDHFCFESTCWNDIRDWGDHFSEERIPIVWGAGRHGAGNNLFIFVEDPDGNKLEISAEIELMTWEQEPREWPHEERTLNLWGTAWLRS